MRAAIPDDAIVIDESCQVGYWSRAGMPVYEPRTYITSGYQGTLGYGFPTALGAKVGNPDRKVVSFNGDGGFMFNVQELATAVQHNIAVAIVVFDDGAFGNVLRIQQRVVRRAHHRLRAAQPRLRRAGRGVRHARRARRGRRTPSAGALREALTHDGPVLIEVPVGPMPNFQRRLREEIAERLAQHLGEAAR